MQIFSDRVSRIHATITRQDDTYLLEVQGLAVFFGPQKVRTIRQELRHGDEFTLVPEHFSVQLRAERLETDELHELEEAAAERPGDPDRLRVWADALQERGDPLGFWLAHPGPWPPLEGPGLAWEDALLRTARLETPGDVVRRSGLGGALSSDPDQLRPAPRSPDPGRTCPRSPRDRMRGS